MNPLVLRELRGTLRSRGFFWAMFGTLLVLGGIFLAVCFGQSLDMNESPERWGPWLFRVCIWSLEACLLLVFPSFTCTALASERERKTFELLETTRMTPGAIVWGKFCAAMLYAGLFLAAALPLVTLSFLFGGVAPAEVLRSFLFLLGLSASVAALCLAISAPFRTVRWPVVLAYLSCWAGLGPLVFAREGLEVLLSEEPRARASLPSLYWDLLLWALPALIFGLVALFCLLLARRSVQHVADNRATALRLFWLGLALAGALSLRTLSELPSAAQQQVFVLWSGTWVLLAACWLACLPWILGCSCESPWNSGRVEGQARRWGRIPLARLLLPGSARGALFALSVTTLTLLAAAWALSQAWPTGWLAIPTRISFQGLGLLISMTLFLCGTGFLLSTLMRPRKARGLLVLVSILLTVLPALAWPWASPGFRAAKNRDAGMRRIGRPRIWTLPFASPTLALGSWLLHARVDDLERAMEADRLQPQILHWETLLATPGLDAQTLKAYGGYLENALHQQRYLRRADPQAERFRRDLTLPGGIPIHLGSMAFFTLSGTAAALWADRRRRRLGRCPWPS